MRLFRLYDSSYAADPISGKGAFLFGARWNERGTLALYTATSLELSTVEAIFRLTPDNRPRYHLLIVDVEDALIQRLDTSVLPADWRGRAYEGRPVQRLLSGWFASSISLGMAVPSSLLPTATGLNVILNPLYPDFTKLVKILENEPFTFS